MYFFLKSLFLYGLSTYLRASLVKNEWEMIWNESILVQCRRIFLEGLRKRKNNVRIVCHLADTAEGVILARQLPSAPGLVASWSSEIILLA
jgi:hypothetical protein